MRSEDHLPAYLTRTFANRAGPQLALLLALAPGCKGEITEHCASVLPEEECPSVEQMAEAWEGQEMCTSPVITVTEVRGFLERREGEGQGDWTTGGERDACCYEVRALVDEYQHCMIGRPLTHQGAIVVAPLRTLSRPWSRAPRPQLDGLSSPARAALAGWYGRQAQAEHASVPAFLRFAAELRAHNAPVELIAEALRAAGDERRHAARAFALASAYAGRELGPGVLRTPSRPVPGLPALAGSTLIEGAVGETLAVLLAVEQLRYARDPAVVTALHEVVEDETRHAALGWRFCRFALHRGGEEVRQALVEALERAPQAARTLVDAGASGAPAETAGHGLLSVEAQARVIEEGLRRVVEPAFAALREELVHPDS